MKIFLKFLFRNIMQKKLRTLLILISIMLSTALVFTTLAISGTAKNMIVTEMRKYIGSSEIGIRRDPQSLNDPFFAMQDIGEVNDQLEYIVGKVNGYAVYLDNEELSVYLTGSTKPDLKTVYNTSFQEINPGFTGYQAYIGAGAKQALGLNIGDKIELLINNQTYDFTIQGIAKNEGLFNYDGQSISIVVPKDTLASIYEADNLVNSILIKTKDGDIDSVIELLKEKYGDDFSVIETITTESIETNVSNLTTTLTLMLIIVLFISIFIIYTAFKVITMERLPMVGTFRSIGATKKMTDIILLGESLIYGVIGGLTGLLLGFGILKIMVNQIAYNPYTKVTAEVDLIFGFSHLLIAFSIAVILSIISALLPVIRIGKMPVRNIVLNQLKIVVKNSYTKMIVGLIIIILPFVLMVISKQPSILIGGLCILATGVAIVFLAPFITKLFVLLFERTNRIFGNEGILAAKNLRDNKGIIQNITLLAIGIASLLIVNIVSTSVAEEVGNVFNDAKFDLVVYHEKADDVMLNQIKSLEGVDTVSGNYTAYDVKYIEKDEYIGYVWGIDETKYFDYWDFSFIGNKQDILPKLSEGRNIMISKVLLDRFQLQVGDEMTLQLDDKEVKYKIVGVVNSVLNNGNYLFMNENHLKEDAKLNYYSDLMVKTSNKTRAIDFIKNFYKSEGINVLDMDVQKQNNMEQNNQIFQLLNGFSFITLLIGTFGIFNNFVVNYISRKRGFAVLRSVGMSKNQLIKMLLIESLSSGMIGGIIGVMGGIIYLPITSYIMKALFVPITIYFSVQLFSIAFILGVVVSLLSALIPSLRSKKLNLVEAIKYE